MRLNRSRIRSWRTALENRKVLSLRNGNNQRFIFAFIGKVMLEFPAQQPGLRPDDIVLVGVVAGWPAIDVYADLLLRSRLGLLVESALADVQKERTKPRRFLEGGTGAYTPDQVSSLVRFFFMILKEFYTR
jgi:hypothetical protein